MFVDAMLVEQPANVPLPAATSHDEVHLVCQEQDLAELVRVAVEESFVERFASEFDAHAVTLLRAEYIERVLDHEFELPSGNPTIAVLIERVRVQTELHAAGHHHSAVLDIVQECVGHVERDVFGRNVDGGSGPLFPIDFCKANGESVDPWWDVMSRT